MSEIKTKLIRENARVPLRANPTDAGADLFSPVTVSIAPHSNYFIPLGIILEIPTGSAGFIYARSGTGSKHGIRPRNCVGVIDSKYRGEVGVMIENASYEHYVIYQGERIAQIVIAPVDTPAFVEAEELDNTDDRGGGFGSTGK